MTARRSPGAALHAASGHRAGRTIPPDNGQYQPVFTGASTTLRSCNAVDCPLRTLLVVWTPRNAKVRPSPALPLRAILLHARSKTGTDGDEAVYVSLVGAYSTSLE